MLQKNLFQHLKHILLEEVLTRVVKLNMTETLGEGGNNKGGKTEYGDVLCLKGFRKEIFWKGFVTQRCTQ